MSRNQPASARLGILLSVLLGWALIFANACNQSPAVQNVAPGAADPTAQMLYVTEQTEVLVFPLTATGSVAPSNTITGFTDAVFTAFDASGNLYVTDAEASAPPVGGVQRTVAQAGSVFVFAPGATGAATPIATITAGLNFPLGIAVDAHGKIYVANKSNTSVTIYGAIASGSATLLATITGEATGLLCPEGLALDGQGRIYVANYSIQYCDPLAPAGNQTGTVTIYASTANGNATPLATITNAPTGLIEPTGLAFDAAGNLYVTDYGAASVTVYAASGYVTPIRTISGAATGLVNPTGAALDANGNIYVADRGANSVFIYKAGANGNVAPTATLTGQFAAGTLNGVTVH